MCIGQDVRGNIKLSLKATLPKPRSGKKNLEDSSPVLSVTEAVNFSSTVDDVSAGEEEAKPSVLRTEGDGEGEGENAENSACLTPSVVVRSAAECDGRVNANSRHASKKAPTKSLPRPYNFAPSHKDKAAPSRSRTDVCSGRKVASLLNTSSHATKEEEDSSPVGVSKPKSCNANSLKLGDRFTAKIYQIRARGLVLEVAGGVRGMYKFEVICKPSKFIYLFILNLEFVTVLKFSEILEASDSFLLL